MSDGTSEQPIGVIAGKYNILRLIGRGGMGAVYEAENSWTKRRVAIKVMRPEYLGQPDVVRRFLQEAQTTAQLQHPNIVDILDMGQEPSDGSLYIVQEFLTGHDLRKYIKESGRLSVQETLGIVVPVADALTAAHERGIIHRDIKPENIFLSRTSRGAVVPKLIDFGISKITQDSEALTKTRTGVAMGTPYYMSPEQTRGDASIDGRSDIWSLAAVIYEMLSGHKVFDAPNYNLLIHKILSERPQRIETVVRDVPHVLAEIIHSGLSVERENRPESMQLFHDRLHRFATNGSAMGGAGLVSTAQTGGVLMAAEGTLSAPYPSGLAFTPVGTAAVSSPEMIAPPQPTLPPASTFQTGYVSAVPSTPSTDSGAMQSTGGGTSQTSVAWTGAQTPVPNRSKRGWIAGVVIAVALLGGGMAVMLNRSKPAVTAAPTAAATQAATPARSPVEVSGTTTLPETRGPLPGQAVAVHAPAVVESVQTTVVPDAGTHTSEPVNVDAPDASVPVVAEAIHEVADAATSALTTAQVNQVVDAGEPHANPTVATSSATSVDAGVARPRTVVRVRRNSVLAPMRGYPQ